MYSRNTWENRSTGDYSIPPGYDGSRFRRRRRGNGAHPSDEEVILIPDSGFAPVSDKGSVEGSAELSVSGIPTNHGAREMRRYSADAENAEDADEPEMKDSSENAEEPKKEKLTGILEKFGFPAGLSSDDLLLCAVIFLIASDPDNGGNHAGDVLLILALLLGTR